MTRASRAHETALVVKSLQMARKRLNEIMESIVGLEADLVPIASHFDGVAKSEVLAGTQGFPGIPDNLGAVEETTPGAAKTHSNVMPVTTAGSGSAPAAPT
jgi:hypothetical protein